MKKKTTTTAKKKPVSKKKESVIVNSYDSLTDSIVYSQDIQPLNKINGLEDKINSITSTVSSVLGRQQKLNVDTTQILVKNHNNINEHEKTLKHVLECLDSDNVHINDIYDKIFSLEKKWKVTVTTFAVYVIVSIVSAVAIYKHIH
jgi:hypothetical protein